MVFLPQSEQGEPGSSGTDDGPLNRRRLVLQDTAEVELQSQPQRLNSKQVYTLDSEDDSEGLDVRWPGYRHASLHFLFPCTATALMARLKPARFYLQLEAASRPCDTLNLAE